VHDIFRIEQRIGQLRKHLFFCTSVSRWL
jgi:hypothetical protein